MKIYFSISLLTVLCFLIWTFPFFSSPWFHIFIINYCPLSLFVFFNTLFKLISTNLLLILGHLIWFGLHSYFYLIAFVWFLSLIFHCLYFFSFFSFHSPSNFHEGYFSTSPPSLTPCFHSSGFPSLFSSSFSGALQSLSLYDQLQAGRTMFLCDWKDRKYAVGSCSC